VLLPLVAVLLGPSKAGGASDPAARAAGGDTLTVLFTAETRGNLLPCACPKEPWGGLARRVRFLREAVEARRHSGTCFVLDAGGFLPEGKVPLRNRERTAREIVGLLLEGLDRAAVQGAPLDHGERAYLEGMAPVETRKLSPVLFEADPPSPARILAWQNRRVALLALEETLPDSTVRRAGHGARAGADLLIVLARADAFSGRRLARLSGADLVLLSRGAHPPAPFTEGKTLLAGCGIEGKEIGEIRLLPASDGLRLAEFRLHPMDSGCPADSVLEARVEDLVRRDGPGSLAAERGE
jgi:hypothetical protein